MIYTAFIFGLISSLHCIGMCGPIAMMLPLERSNPTKKAIQILLYHAGRLTAYGTLGLIFGFLGKGLYLAGMQQQLSIIAGVLIITIVIIPEKVFSKYNFSRPIYTILSKIKTSLGSQFKKKTLNAIFTIGLLNGFLPCGLVYAALFGAIAMQNEFYGATYMLFYGIGTIPMMSAVVYMTTLFSNPFRNKIQKLIPIVTLCIGVLFIMRGLGMGIPYLSPSTMSLYVQANPNCH
jgi:sulfite exporter TauE/SafE